SRRGHGNALQSCAEWAGAPGLVAAPVAGPYLRLRGRRYPSGIEFAGRRAGLGDAAHLLAAAVADGDVLARHAGCTRVGRPSQRSLRPRRRHLTWAESRQRFNFARLREAQTLQGAMVADLRASFAPAEKMRKTFAIAQNIR